eukprot:CAMPEP_0175069388 /NCGR_PEP_ID=MMETSP0052_2-20121109/18169_1 /TAXON_ID=51329 ORGANISM="Polytomella parva, Strain SAG 63-3" /NCGR_SAMPLE_ID=MMETSP0052_2 /ASSEMBLY_ACC=CAM_ASM_000194 /LENGTH=378 /DNA_ID=CAMNT_0016336461 /DNA_START=124 /DNA_END=1260 /DNA_ORIENTATION=-
MGKGGTRFIGDSISSRVNRQGATTSKDVRKNIEKYLETGHHPDLEWAKKERAIKIPPLPEFDPSRPYVFLDVAVGNKPLGRLVIELFMDIVPVPANHLLTRFLSGSSNSLHQSSFYKLHPGYAIYGGKSTAASTRLPHCVQLRSIERGVVSVSESGDEFAISLNRALELDLTHQAVGRIVPASLKLLEPFDALSTLPDNSPSQRVAIVRCGKMNHLGVFEDLDSPSEGGAQGVTKLSPEEEALLKEQSKAEIMRVMERSLASKRRAESSVVSSDSPSASSSTAGPGSTFGGGSPHSRDPKRTRIGRKDQSGKGSALDVLLGGDCSDSSTEEEEEEESGEDGEAKRGEEKKEGREEEKNEKEREETKEKSDNGVREEGI